MSDRSQWKMLHLLYTSNQSGLSYRTLQEAGVDCYNDTILVLRDVGLVADWTGVDPQTNVPVSGFALTPAARAMLRSFVVANRRWPGEDLRVDYPQAFVIMPFSQPWSQQVYATLIKPAVEAAGILCVRGDEPVRVGDLAATIWTALMRSGLMIADVSAVNANVFYELGLAHALGKDIFILKQQDATIPADFGGAHYYEYRLDALDAARDVLQQALIEWVAHNAAQGVKAIYRD